MANPSALHPDLADALGLDANTMVTPKSGDNTPTPATEPNAANQQAAPARKWADRYDTPEELEKAKLASDKEAQRMSVRQRELEAQLQANQQLLQNLTSPDRMSPAARSASRPEFEDVLEKAGIPLAELEQLIADRAEKIANKSVQSRFEPFVAAAQAQEKISQIFPEFNQAEPQLRKFLNDNPELQQRYNEKLERNQNHPEDALEWAMQTYLIHNATAQPSRESVSGAAEQAAARQAAALPSSGTGAAQRLGPQQQYTADLDAASEMYNAGKISKAQLLAVRLGTINPFSQPNP